MTGSAAPSGQHDHAARAVHDHRDVRQRAGGLHLDAVHQTRKGDYWVGDSSGRSDNTLRNSGQGGFRWWLPRANRNSSENLRAYGAQYRYVAVINFNRSPDEQRAYRGYGIFVHVKNGTGTAGCIGITAGQMRQVLRYLRPGDKITIRR
jgi:L,D-peptidoglycan transpeptidase YkuD (ErfK/YbiS/YcfS/YnhG family)